MVLALSTPAFADGAIAGTAGVASVPIEIVNKLPVLSIAVGDQKIPVSFDLGGEDIELTTQVLETISVQNLPETYTWLDAKGNKLQARKFRIPELRIGGLVFHDVLGHEDAEAANYPKVHAGLGLVGITLFQTYTMVFDLFWKDAHADFRSCSQPTTCGLFRRSRAV